MAWQFFTCFACCCVFGEEKQMRRLIYLVFMLFAIGQAIIFITMLICLMLFG
ncbi:hypothetical protein HMPREF9535_03654 [Escherichia coli MS 78-1]|nr:hypothetical protein HMPREF9535_03654 [Escherichia coli MS 78-1]